MSSGLDGVNLLPKGFDLKSEILFTVCMRLASCKPVKHWLSTDFCYGWIPCLTRIIPTTSIAAEFPTVTVKSRPSNRFESNSIGTFVLFPKFANNGVWWNLPWLLLQHWERNCQTGAQETASKPSHRSALWICALPTCMFIYMNLCQHCVLTTNNAVKVGLF